MPNGSPQPATPGASVGAGFIYPLLGAMRTMPGLGMTPAYMKVDIDETGEAVGMF